MPLDNDKLTRLAGTILFTVVTTAILVIGLWVAARYLIALTPPYVAIPAILGTIAAPIGLLHDVIKLNERSRQNDDSGQGKMP